MACRLPLNSPSETLGNRCWPCWEAPQFLHKFSSKHSLGRAQSIAAVHGWWIRSTLHPRHLSNIKCSTLAREGVYLTDIIPAPTCASVVAACFTTAGWSRYVCASFSTERGSVIFGLMTLPEVWKWCGEGVGGISVLVNRHWLIWRRLVFVSCAVAHTWFACLVATTRWTHPLTQQRCVELPCITPSSS